MNIEAILESRGCTVQHRGGWSSFNHPSLRLAGISSSRLGKYYKSGELVFTLGETGRGKEVALSPRILELLGTEQLNIVRMPSTAGQRRTTSEYIGFDTRLATGDQIASVVSKVLSLVDSLAQNPG